MREWAAPVVAPETHYVDMSKTLRNTVGLLIYIAVYSLHPLLHHHRPSRYSSLMHVQYILPDSSC